MKKFATVTVGGKLLELDAPGLKTRRRKDGSTSIYWEAPSWAPGFSPRSVRFDPDWSAADDFEPIAAECRALQARALAHARGPTPVEQLPQPQGSLGELCALYLAAASSPFQRLKPSTQDTYRRWIKLLRPYEPTPLSEVDREMLQGWFDELGTPSGHDSTPLARRATSGLQMLRMLFQFGAITGLPHCAALEHLSRDRAFDEAPKPRRAMTAHYAARFVQHALAAGEIRLALAQACQFELRLAQAQVIGEWHDILPGDVGGPDLIIFQRRYWAGGLTFEMLTGEILSLPGKNGPATFDLRQHPLVKSCMGRIEVRSGPFVVRHDGRPYDRFTFSRAWRALATEAGLPSDIWNSDSARR